MTANLPVVDPARVLCPVLLAKGEYDGISTLEDLQAFYAKLPNGDRQLSVVAGAAHSVIVSRSHKAFHHIVEAFLAMPRSPAQQG
jgi:pimeloyl-ACP methyl ester carboxylesterase